MRTTRAHTTSHTLTPTTDLCCCCRDDIVEALLLQARPLIERHPLCRDRAAAYRERLKARAI